MTTVELLCRLGKHRVVFRDVPTPLGAYFSSFFSAVSPAETTDRRSAIAVNFRVGPVVGVSFDVVARGPNWLAGVDEGGEFAFHCCGFWCVRTNGDSVDVALFRGGELSHWDLLNQALFSALTHCLARAGVVCLHAASFVARDPDGPRVLLLVGESMAGKSTISLAVARAGVGVLVGDDRILVDVADSAVFSMGQPITFRPGTSDLIPELAQFDDPAFDALDDEQFLRTQKVGVDLALAFRAARRLVARGSFEVVLLNRIGECDKPVRTALSGTEACDALLSDSAYVGLARPLARNLMAEVVAGARCSRFTYGAGRRNLCGAVQSLVHSW